MLFPFLMKAKREIVALIFGHCTTYVENKQGIEKKLHILDIIYLMIELKVKILKCFKEKVIGLIGSKNSHAVLIKTRFGIHTFGLKFPIDVLVLNNKDRVVRISKGLKQNRIFVWPPNYNKVIELPKGEIDKNQIRIGDKIKIINAD